jgi:hypothetical protein
MFQIIARLLESAWRRGGFSREDQCLEHTNPRIKTLSHSPAFASEKAEAPPPMLVAAGLKKSQGLLNQDGNAVGFRVKINCEHTHPRMETFEIFP